MTYLSLAFAIVFEVIATTSMKKTEGFTVLIPTLIVLICYCISFFSMSLVMKTMPVGVVYATWSGLGIVLVSVSSYYLYQQKLDLPAVIGMGFIIVGVVLMNVFSKASVH